MADVAAVEDLYESILGRASDAGGLAYWQNQLDSGVSLDQVKQGFYNSDEYQSTHVGGASTQPSTSGSTDGNGTTVLGQDMSKLQWDDLANDVYNGKIAQGSGTDSGPNMQNGYGYSQILKANVQGVIAEGPNNRTWTGSGESGTVDWYNPLALSAIALKDKNGPEGYMTQLYRQDDGSVGVTYYKEQDTFLQDFAQFVSIAATMAAGVGALNAMGAETAGAAAGWTSGYDLAMGSDLLGATGAAGAAGLPSDLGSALTKDFPGMNSLGSGMNGLDTVDSLLKVGTVGPGDTFNLGGMTMLSDGSLIPASDLFGAAAPWVNPATSTITDVVVNSAGSVNDLLAGADPWSKYVAGMGDVLPSTGNNWWDKITDGAKSVTDGLGVKDLITGIGAIGAVTSVINGKNGTSTTGPTINFPEIKQREPSSGPLSLPINQRAGVRFGQTRSKRELRGKFSGTGLKI